MHVGCSDEADGRTFETRRKPDEFTGDLGRDLQSGKEPQRRRRMRGRSFIVRARVTHKEIPSRRIPGASPMIWLNYRSPANR